MYIDGCTLTLGYICLGVFACFIGPIQILSSLLTEMRKTVSVHSAKAKLLDDECIELQEKLIAIDPLRQDRYEDRRKSNIRFAGCMKCHTIMPAC